MKVLCVLNHNAAGGDAKRLWPDVAELLQRQSIDFDLLSVQGDLTIKDQVSAYLDAAPPNAYSVVAGIGGDGTHSGVMNGIMQFGASSPSAKIPAYAFIPMGTGNDIAKSLGIRLRSEYSAKDLRRAVSTILHGADYRLDLGRINGTYFVDALTIGLDSRILQKRNVSKRKIEKIPFLKFLARGKFLYSLSVGSRFFMHEPVEAEVIVDGRSWYKGQMINVVINNTRIYAGDFDFSMDAYPDDGMLDVVLFTDHTDYLTRYLLAIRHNPDKIRDYSDELHRRSMHIQGRNIEVRMTRHEPAQIDGEEFREDSLFKITIIPRAILIKTPVEPL
ncbi:MAG: diacylglycerol kinase family protein [bacterium]